MTERFRNVSPVYFSSDGRWSSPGAEFPRGTSEIEALIAGVIFARGDRWQILWEWNGIPHIYDWGIWQQHGQLDQWTFRLYGEEEPLVPGRYRVTVWRNQRAVAQGEFAIRGSAPPSGGQIAISEIGLFQYQGRHLVPGSRGGADALGVTLSYAGLPRGALVHIIWRHDGEMLAVENRHWNGPSTGEELLVHVPETQQGLERGLYELWVACWPNAPLYRSLHY